MGILLKSICDTLILEEGFVTTVSITASKRYKEFYINKKDGGKRLIVSPSQELKALQRFILDNLLYSFPIHESAYAYKKSLGIKHNALVHVKNNYLLRIDFKDFFQSITSKDLRSYYETNKDSFPEGWDLEDTFLLSKLVFKSDRLTIGAVTSPCLSNILCYELDELIAIECGKLGVSYSRYSDDLYFSCNAANVLFGIEPIVVKILKNLSYPSSLFINREKTIHSSRKRRRSVTGLVISNTGGLSIGRKNKRLIKSQVYKWDQLDEPTKLHLKGKLNYISDVEPEFINSLCSKFTAGKVLQIIKYTPVPVV